MAIKKARYNKVMSRKKGPVIAKKVVYDGIKFASGLEKNMYIALKDAGIEAEYEPKSYQLLPTFFFGNKCVEKQANGKGALIDRGQKKILGIKYTPDFEAYDFVIETKGRANDSFPLRWKLFKNHLRDIGDERTLYKPQNKKDIDETIKLILKFRREKENEQIKIDL